MKKHSKLSIPPILRMAG